MTDSTETESSGVSTVESFALHPCSDNINLSTAEGRTLFLSATVELSDDKKIAMPIDNSHREKNHLETCSSKCSWGLLLGKVTDSSG